MNQSAQTELPFWLAASQLSGVSLPKLLQWLSLRGDYQSLFAGEQSELVAAGFTALESEKIKKINWHSIEKEQNWYETKGSILTLNDPRYPRLLKEIADPPLVLYVLGEVGLLELPQLAIVGSRNPSPWGLETAALFAKALAEKGLIITSGLALGIDSACHQGTLAAQGKTIAVMGTGLNQIYPRVHLSLAEKISQQGAVITEFPLNTPPTPWNFPRRNRIISGLSLGVLVVEAAPKSGSLITARYAAEQNREVFAIPGSIHHTLARGCHQLIRQGAKLVESAEDVLEELDSLTAFVKDRSSLQPSSAGAHPAAEALEKSHLALLAAVDYSVTALDTLLLRSGLTAGEVSSMLLILELKGYVQAVQGGYLRCL